MIGVTVIPTAMGGSIETLDDDNDHNNRNDDGVKQLSQLIVHFTSADECWGGYNDNDDTVMQETDDITDESMMICL